MVVAASCSPLPQEIIDQITDELQEDFSTLKACALVSRPWKESSQRHIFSDIFFEAPPESLPLETSPCYTFHRLLITSPHLGRHVRHLEICDEGRTSDSTRRWLLASVEILMSVISLLTCLSSVDISFSGLWWEDVSFNQEHPRCHFPARVAQEHRVGRLPGSAERVVQSLPVSFNPRFIDFCHRGPAGFVPPLAQVLHAVTRTVTVTPAHAACPGLYGMAHFTHFCRRSQRIQEIEPFCGKLRRSQRRAGPTGECHTPETGYTGDSNSKLQRSHATPA
ncbi:hypothetical protein EDD18DRAFT_603972 [Armillaria luteobubalina]|uniref:F-box domain-containing protein n=1 Tax=Armillaria luteobubalina TaxID=153913 RepID=A0AA39QJE7_9AGAR|nr:hypothetical protein EDD18DRAFT_603972 [Armillaria luteobubalina]